MIVIGITGSIGMGKTTLANMMRARGIPVHDSDAAVHRLLGPGGDAVGIIGQILPAISSLLPLIMQAAPLAAAIAIVVLATAVAYATGKSEFSAETLLFQLTMPGFDEELMFRAVLLGLLLVSLRERLPVIGNPAVLITAVLFGFMHALTLDKNLSVSFEPIYFVQTGIGGFVWAWIAMRTRSILLPILSHNLANFLAAAVTMVG